MALAAVLAALATAGAVPARAADESGAEAAAMALFTEGRRLMAAGDFADACPKFAESRRLSPGVGTTLNLALCYEGLGKTASAWLLYQDAASAAHAKGETEREAAAKARARRLEPDLLHVTIAVAPQPSEGTVAIKLDGQPLPEEHVGSAMPVDPGRHEIEANAPGKQPWVSTFDVAPGPAATLTIPVLIRRATAPDAADELSGPPLDSPHEANGTANGTHDAEGNMKRIGVIVGAAGLTTLGIGLAFVLAANNEKENAQAYCNKNGCTPAGQADLSRSGTDADIASVLVPLGIAGVAAGTTIWFLAPHGPHGDASRSGARSSAHAGFVRIAPSITANRWSLTATGAF
jgi:hypothetical protein